TALVRARRFAACFFFEHLLLQQFLPAPVLVNRSRRHDRQESLVSFPLFWAARGPGVPRLPSCPRRLNHVCTQVRDE
ncbi:hypothetical protein M433DRAFT_87704, partial [Acidomyces richmondensis BFW]